MVLVCKELKALVFINSWARIFIDHAAGVSIHLLSSSDYVCVAYAINCLSVRVKKKIYSLNTPAYSAMDPHFLLQSVRVLSFYLLAGSISFGNE